MTPFETWAYRAIIAAALVVIWYFAQRVLNELKEMNSNIKTLSDKGIQHDGKLELVQSKVETHENRLNEHSKRLRDVEKKQDACQYCNE